MPFIYLATFKDGSVYVGQTGGTLEALRHRYYLYTINGNAERRVEYACLAYGEPAFQILETCEAKIADIREQHWLEHYRLQPGFVLNAVPVAKNNVLKRKATLDRKRSEKQAALAAFRRA